MWVFVRAYARTKTHIWHPTMETPLLIYQVLSKEFGRLV